MLVMAVIVSHRLIMGVTVGMGQMLMILPTIAAMEGQQELAPRIEAGHARRHQQQGDQGQDDSHQQGTDALTTKFDLDVMWIERNGKKPLRDMLS